MESGITLLGGSQKSADEMSPANGRNVPFYLTPLQGRVYSSKRSNNLDNKNGMTINIKQFQFLE